MTRGGTLHLHETSNGVSELNRLQNRQEDGRQHEMEMNAHVVNVSKRLARTLSAVADSKLSIAHASSPCARFCSSCNSITPSLTFA
jgi:hypothetical protein